MSSIVDKTKKHFLTSIHNGDPTYFRFPQHAQEVERWVHKILHFYPEADKEVVLISVWLHDIGQADGNYDVDHAIKSEEETISFLSKNNYPKDKIDKVAHCVRAHRCKDVQPNSIEAKILATADSASHMTDIIYFLMLSEEHLPKDKVLDKLERDYREKNFLPKELQPEVNDLYEAWKGLIKAFPEHNE